MSNYIAVQLKVSLTYEVPRVGDGEEVRQVDPFNQS